MRLVGWKIGRGGSGPGADSRQMKRKPLCGADQTGHTLRTAGKHGFIDFCRVPCGLPQAVGSGHRAGCAGRWVVEVGAVLRGLRKAQGTSGCKVT